MIMANDNVKIDYDSLLVDKENEEVFYNDAVHQYWTKSGKEKCISCTTLIHNYVPVFDSEFWCRYKSLEALVDKETFAPIRKLLNDSKRWNDKYISDLGIELEDFENKRLEILAEWDKKNKDACERGTEIHRIHELAHLKGETEELKYLKLGGKFTPKTDNKIVNGSHVYPELLLSYVTDSLKVAGQADLIIVDGWDVFVLDYKSNRKLDKKSFFNQKTKKSSKMLYPLNNLDDCNFMHYSMQLSTYGYMIQQIDPRFNIKGLTLIHLDHDGGCTFHECEYLKSDVERMLEHYKKQVENENWKNSRTPFKY